MEGGRRETVRKSGKKQRKGLEGSRGGKLKPEKLLYNKQEVQADHYLNFSATYILTLMYRNTHIT